MSDPGTTTTAADLFARDFDRLEPGARASTRGRTITEADLTSFSALTGDWHRQHSDAVWAGQSDFGERIAHGLLLISYAIGLLPIDDERVVALRGIRGVVFKRPAPIGTTIHADAKLLETKPVDDNCGLVALRLDVRDAEARIMARGTIDAIWRRRVPELAAAPVSNGVYPASHEGDLAPVFDGRVCI